MELPFAQDRELIARAVATSGSGRLWLAGTQLAGGEDEVRGWIAELRDDEWIFHLVDTPPDIPTELRALAAGRTGAVAVGSAQPSMLLLETCDVETPADATEDQPIDDATEGPSPAEDAASAGGEDSAGETTAGEEETARRGATRLVAQGKSAPPPFGPTFEPKKWRVRDVSRKHGMETNVKTWAGFIHDIDGNGWDDIFYSRHLLEPPRLLLADENGLRDAPGSGFSVIDRHGCDASDLDGNGQADIFCTVGRVRGTATGRHELSMNPATEQAAIARNSAGAVDPLGRGRYATFIDHDGDGDEDLFLTTIKRRVDGLPGGNHFFENVDGRFVPAPEVGLDTAVGSKCLWSGDIDGDGDEDLINCVANPDDGRPAGVRLYRNDKGRLVDRTAGRGISPMGDVDVAVADVDGDDLPDLIQLAEGRLRVSTQTDGGFVKTYEASTTNAVAIAAGDVNRDKLADIYVLRGGDKTNGKDFLLVNRGNGTVFQSARIPQTKKGDADDVLAIDFDRNGRTDFVVLNGADRPGPVQLLATLPRK